MPRYIPARNERGLQAIERIDPLFGRGPATAASIGMESAFEEFDHVPPDNVQWRRERRCGHICASSLGAIGKAAFGNGALDWHFTFAKEASGKRMTPHTSGKEE